jgi:hypothetical protein
MLAAAPALVWQHLQWNHFYSARYALHYVATPKAACTALKWWFAGIDGVLPDLAQAHSIETLPSLTIHDTLPFVPSQREGRTAEGFTRWATLPDVLRFAFVRHPVARVFSAWSSKVILAEPHQAAHLAPEQTQCSLRTASEIMGAFERFVDQVVAREAAQQSWSDPHWAPQTLLLQPQVLEYTGGIHQIEHLPEFAQQLRAWGDRLGVDIPFTLERHNESLLWFSPQWISDAARRQLATLYAEDFAAFGYDCATLPPGRAAPSAHELESIWAQICLVRERNARFAALRQRVLELTAEVERFAPMREELQWRREQVCSHERYIAELLQAAQHRELTIDNMAREHERQLAAIFQSRSWRLTAPLRKLSRLFSGR